MNTSALIFNFLRGKDQVTPHLRRIAAQASAANRQLRWEGRLTTLIWGAMATVIAGAVAQAIAFGNAIAPMAGALGALPAIVFSLAAGLSAVIVGFKGLGAAMKTTQSAGGAANALAAAERRVAQAQKQALQAQQAINESRAEAARRLADITRELARARLDEEGAVLAVTEAQVRLREARQSGDRLDIKRAELGHRDAILSLEEVRARLADVTEEEAKRTAAGVDGSEEVRQATDRYADALENLAEAQRALKQGAGGGADKAAEAYAKLTAEGRALVDVLKAMGPAWRTVQQAVQSTMLRGVAGDIKALSKSYLPVMRQQLPAIAQGWNNLFRGGLQAATTAGFVDDINKSLGHSATLWQRIGSAFAPFLSGFRHWIVIGSDFLPRLGAWVLTMAKRFDAWSAKVRETGKAHGWIENALVVGKQLNQLLGAVFSATGKIFKLGGDPALLQNLIAGAQAFRDWLDTAEGQDRVTGMMREFRSILSAAWAAFKTLMDVISQADLSGVVTGFDILNSVLKFLGEHMDVVNALLPVLIPLFIAYKTQVTAIRVGYGLMNGVARISAFYTKDLGRIIGGVGKVMKTTVVRSLALRAALMAGTVVTWAQTAATWALAAANTAAFWWIIAIVAAIALVVAGIVWLATKTTFFQDQWKIIWGFLKWVWAWIKGPFVDGFMNAYRYLRDLVVGYYNWVVDTWTRVLKFVLSLPGKVTAAAKGIWEGLKSGLKAAVNWIIGVINGMSNKLNSTVIAAVNHLPGVSIPNIPNIPYLERGGTITRGGAAVVADRNGQGGEVVSLPRGAQVTPLSRAGGGVTTIRIELCGPEDVKKLIRKIVRTDGGGNVQVAFGK